MQLDRTKSFGVVIGHKTAKYEQNGILFDVKGDAITNKQMVAIQRDTIIETDAVDSGRLFLLNVLKSGPLSKSAIYKIAADNNQHWDSVNKAAVLLGIVKFSYNKATMWKLPEDVGVL